MQAGGRAGRDATIQSPSELWVQTGYPQHPLFEALKRHDYPAFAAQQLKDREAAAMPPFAFQALVRAEARTQEVVVASEILQSLGLRMFVPSVTACPGCGRTTSTYFQKLAQDIQSHIRHRMPEWRKQYVGVEEMNVAVMGCVVNGPGEAREADIGIAGGKGEAVLFVHGEPVRKLTGENILDQFMEEIDKL